MAKVNTIKDAEYLPFREENDEDSLSVTKIENKENKEDNRRDDYETPVKFIYKPYIARRLVTSHNLVDIVPDQQDSERTVFVFEDSLRLRDDMLRIIKSKNSEEEVKEVGDKYLGDRKVIIIPCIARRLINRNHKVVDIEANK
jgi:hypothetical protein